MKSLITLLFVLACGVVAFANTNDHGVVPNPKIESYAQVEFSQMGYFLDSGTGIVAKHTKNTATNKTEIARLYKFKNSRIKKALAFRTKRNKAKMA